MFRFLFLRLFLPLILFLILRAVLKSVWGTAHSSVTPRGSGDAPVPDRGGDLKKDPVCGTYVAVSASVTKMVDGRAVYFCSKDCRDKYRAA
jgi:YHS domain-containing protein